ncbi:hypothetical protein F5B20DRAFT_585125 [Whalleya microplaca]|nr:hypothetical protein F5B20DRAFT_585125 [Whalleya microplaca]
MRLSTIARHFAILVAVSPTGAWPNMTKEEAVWVILLNDHRNKLMAEYNDARAYLEAVEVAAAKYGDGWILVNEEYESRYNGQKVFPWGPDVHDADVIRKTST